METYLSADLVLTKAIWNEDVRRNIVNKALTEEAGILERRIKANIDNSTPAGRLYSKFHGSRQNLKTGSVRVYKKKHKGIFKGTATTYYQASAWGQPPARVFSNLYNSIRVRRVPGEYRLHATVNAPGAAVLDSPEGLNRPFFRSLIFDTDESSGRVTVEGTWNFRQAVKRIISLMLNVDINAARTAKRHAKNASRNKGLAESRRKEKQAALIAQFREAFGNDGT